MTKNKKVLVVDHGSSYISHLKNMYTNHPDNSYTVHSVTHDKVKQLSKKDLKDYDIIHLSGSRVKKNLNDEVSNYIIKNAHKETYIIGTCYGAQVLAKHHGVDSKRLSSHQKGKQQIQYKGKKEHIHKSHSWGIPLKGADSKLEHIASSDQEFHNGAKGKIYEVFKARSNPRHIGIQGHAEKGVGKKLMYEILDSIPYKK